MLTRRQFAGTLLAGAAASALRADGPAGPRLAVSTWSFHNYFPNTRYGNPQFKLEEWRIEDVIRRAKQDLDIDAFEVSSAHLASQENKYLDDLKEFVRMQNCRLIHLSDNVRGLNLAAPDAQAREEATRTFERLIGVAQRLGIPSMRVNTGTPDPKMQWDMETTIASFRRLSRYAKERGVEIVIENHFGISADPRNVVRIIEAVNDNISSCPDFGLFRNDEERWTGLPLMLRHCKRIVSAKFHGLDNENRHAAFDLERCWRMMRESKFTGYASLEYEGNLEPMPQLRRMAQLARKWLAA